MGSGESPDTRHSPRVLIPDSPFPTPDSSTRSSSMRYRTFPGTDVSVSEVGFGTWTLATGWWGEKTDDEAVAMMRRALDEHGVNFFDAADTYGNGRSERQLAEAFRGRRHEVVY